MADKDMREQRLAEALRANLRRRKAQARQQAEPATDRLPDPDYRTPGAGAIRDDGSN